MSWKSKKCTKSFVIFTLSVVIISSCVLNYFIFDASSSNDDNYDTKNEDYTTGSSWEKSNTSNNEKLKFTYQRRDEAHNRWLGCKPSTTDQIEERLGDEKWIKLINIMQKDSMSGGEMEGEETVCASDYYDNRCTCISKRKKNILFHEVKLEVVSDETFSFEIESVYCRERGSFMVEYPLWIAVSFYEEDTVNGSLYRREVVIDNKEDTRMFFNFYEKSMGYSACFRNSFGDKQNDISEDLFELPSSRDSPSSSLSPFDDIVDSTERIY